MKRTLVAVFVIGVAVLAVTLLPMMASVRSQQVRDVRLVVRDMTFYLEGNPEPNPTLTLRAGEQVRVHIRNDEPGMRHDFAVKAWSVASRMLEDRGEQDVLTFRVPEQRGETAYSCTPHSKMMSGTLRVE